MVAEAESSDALEGKDAYDRAHLICNTEEQHTAYGPRGGPRTFSAPDTPVETPMLKNWEAELL